MTMVSDRPTVPAVHAAESIPERRRAPPPLPDGGNGRAERAAAAGFALLGCLVFFVAALLSPYDAAGRPLAHGTHRQLGLPPCALKTLTGLPCPSCGMTTSISLVMHGDLVAAREANWAGVVVAALGLAATAWLAAVAAGIPPGRCTVEVTIKWLALAGATAALLRWGGLAMATLPHAWRLSGS